MTNRKTPGVNPVERVDPTDEYKMRSIEQILMLFDGGDFMAEILPGHKTATESTKLRLFQGKPEACPPASAPRAGLCDG